MLSTKAVSGLPGVASRGGGSDWLERFQNKGEDFGYATFARSVQAILSDGGPTKRR